MVPCFAEGINFAQRAFVVRVEQMNEVEIHAPHDGVSDHENGLARGTLGRPTLVACGPTKQLQDVFADEKVCHVLKSTHAVVDVEKPELINEKFSKDPAKVG